jgi:hypothetical protein
MRVEFRHLLTHDIDSNWDPLRKVPCVTEGRRDPVVEGCTVHMPKQSINNDSTLAKRKSEATEDGSPINCICVSLPNVWNAYLCFEICSRQTIQERMFVTFALQSRHGFLLSFNIERPLYPGNGTIVELRNEICISLEGKSLINSIRSGWCNTQGRPVTIPSMSKDRTCIVI